MCILQIGYTVTRIQLCIDILRITISHRVALPSWQKTNPILISSYSWKTRKKTKVSSLPPAPSFGSPGLPSMYLKLGTRKGLVGGGGIRPLPFHLLPVLFLPTPFFSRLKLSLAGVKLPIQRPNGYLNGGNMRQPKSMRNVHAAKSHISTGSRMVRTGHPFGHRAEAGDAGRRGQPGSRDTPANAKSSPISKQEEESHLESGAFGFCAQSAAGARQPGAPQRITQAEQQPSSPLGCAA